MKVFKDRVAVVTGAASGIGRELAANFIRAGMRVVLADIDENNLKTTVKTFKDSGICKECKKERSLCIHPETARPAPEAMAVDVFSTVKKIGYPIPVRTESTQVMDRYVFLMIH